MEGHEARGRADDCGDERGGQTRGGARLATRRRRQRGSRVERDGGGEEKKEQGEEEPRQRPHGEMEVRPRSDRICSSSDRQDLWTRIHWMELLALVCARRD